MQDIKTLGQSFQPYSESIKQPHIIISGFPYNSYLKNSRKGGDKGSFIFRSRLIQSDINMYNKCKILDCGQIHKQLAFAQASKQIINKHYLLLQQSPISLIYSISGTHFSIIPNYKSLRKYYPNDKIGIINISNELYFNEKIGDSLEHQSNFKSMLQQTIFDDINCQYVQFGLKKDSSSQQNLCYLQKRKIKTILFNQNIRKLQNSQSLKFKTQGGQYFNNILQQISRNNDKIMIIFDINSICAKWMRGTSKPNLTGGFSNIESLEIFSIAGMNNKLSLVQISEFNPGIQSIFSSSLLIEMFYQLANSFKSNNRQ